MKHLLYVGILFSSPVLAHPLLVTTAPVRAGMFRPEITAFGRVHGPDRVTVQAPYAALMGPLVVSPGRDVAAGAVIARLIPARLAGVVRAQEARVAAARAAYEQSTVLARQGLMTPARARSLKAVWQSADAVWVAETRRLARGVVRAPFAGTVRYATAPGAWLVRGANVAEIGGASGLYETVALTVRDADKMFRGALVTRIRATQGDSSSGGGRIYALAARLDRLGLVRAYVRGLKGPLRPGQILTLRLYGHRQKALAVPRAAVLVSHAQARVYVIADGRARAVPVVVRSSRAQRVWVTGPLADGASVISSGITRLRAGTPVRVRP